MVAPEELEVLAQRVEPGSELLRNWQLAGGISAQMQALELRRADGSVRRLVLRRPGDHAPVGAAAQELGLLRALCAAGLPSPRPLGLVELPGRTCLWLEYIDGQPDFQADGRPERPSLMAAQLARIHACSVEALDCLPRPAAELSQLPGWSARPVRLQREARLRRALAAHWSSPGRQVLLHGDFWPGNILWRAGQIVAVIDWEDAQRGDPLLDLAISRLDLLWIYGRLAMEQFTAAYARETAADLARLPFFDLRAALRPGSNLARWAAGYAARGRPDIHAAGLQSAREEFAAEALARLEG